MGRIRATSSALIASALVLGTSGSTRAMPSRTVTAPIIMGAGDIACDPSDVNFNAGFGTSTACRMMATASLLASAHPSAVFTLGDNQYEDATLTDFQRSYGPSWGQVKSITRPAPGHHEYFIKSAAGYFSYFGAAAGNQATGYYSYNLAGWHIIVLNSACNNLIGGCAMGSPEDQWLRSDLASHPASCTLAYWHVARFSSVASHSAVQPFWQALYDYHADIVLSAGEHSYERFAPQTPSGVRDNQNGITEFAVGTGGKSLVSFNTILPNSVARNNTVFGVLKLTLLPTGYTWQFVSAAGKTTYLDSGTAGCH